MPRAARLAVAPTPDPDSPREVLRARLRDLAAADAAIREAERMVAQGEANLIAVQARAATGEDAERRIRAHRVQVLKNGGSGADDLPEVLELARSVARRAQDGLADAQAVLADLEADLVTAREARAAALGPVEVAAQVVIRAEDAPRLAAELAAANALRDRLHREVEALSTIQVRHGFVGYFPGCDAAPHYRANGPIMLGPEVGAALHPQPDWLGLTPAQTSAVPAAWGSYFRALQEDADAIPPA